MKPTGGGFFAKLEGDPRVGRLAHLDERGAGVGVTVKDTFGRSMR